MSEKNNYYHPPISTSTPLEFNTQNTTGDTGVSEHLQQDNFPKYDEEPISWPLRADSGWLGK